MNKISAISLALLLTSSTSAQAGTLLLECNNQDVLVYEPQDGEVYLEIPDKQFTSEYIGTKMEGDVITMKFLGILDRTKVELIIVKNGSITLKHYTKHKCKLIDSNVK